MSTYVTQAVVLNKYDYKDYDIKFILYTLEYGKIAVIAKGAKRITSKLNSHLEFFSFSKIMIAKGVLVNRLAGAQLIEKYQHISEDNYKTIIALYFLEVVNLMVKYDFEDDYIFDIIIKFNDGLNHGVSKQDDLLLLNQTLFELLDHLGYRPQLKSSKQKGLIAQFNKVIMEISDKEVKSYDMISNLFN